MTTVRVLTPAGRGAIATLAVSGDRHVLDEPPPLFRAANQRPVAELPVGRVAFGTWGAAPAEQVVVCRTADATIEIYCHGGAAAVARIVTDLAARGCDISGVAPAEGEYGGVLDQECRHAVSQATTLRTADFLLQQQSGLLCDAFEELHRAGPETAIRQIDDLLRWSEFGVHLTQPWRVVLCGRPNVGKASLINALAGFSRSIVIDEPGTTRDVVTTETALDGWPVILFDTAGLRDAADELETAGIERAQRTIAAADLRVLLVDTSAAPQPEDRRLLTTWPDALVVAHKCDLPCVWGDELPPGALPVSSMTGAGVDRLMEEIVRRLVPVLPPPMTPMPVARRQVHLLREIRRLLDVEPGGEDVRRRIAALVTVSSADLGPC